MARANRIGAAALATVAVALTVVGVVIAATNTNPSATTRDPLALNGYPPRTADVRVTLTTGTSVDATADVAVNFATNSAAAVVQIPLPVASVAMDVRVLPHHVYLGFTNLPSILGVGWLAAPVRVPNLYGWSLELTKPDLYLITGYTTTVTHSGYSTTYTYSRPGSSVSLPNGLPFALPSSGLLRFSITTGSQGEVTGASATVDSRSSTPLATLTATVVSYNAPAPVVGPPRRDVTPINARTLRRVFGTSSISSLLGPLLGTGFGTPPGPTTTVPRGASVQ